MEPPNSEQDFDKKPADMLLRCQKPNKGSAKTTEAPDSTEHAYRDENSQTRAQQWTANPAEGGVRTKVHNWLDDESCQGTQEPELQHSSLLPSDLKQLEITYFYTPYPDDDIVKELSVRMDVSENVIDEWFENKRTEAMKYFQVQAMQGQQQQQLYNQQLLVQGHHDVSQPVVMAQANSSSSYIEQQYRTEGYFSNQNLSQLESLFKNGMHYPDIPKLSLKLSIPERLLAIWFENRRKMSKKPKTEFYSRVALMHQQQIMTLQATQQPKLQYQRMTLQQIMEQQQQQMMTLQTMQQQHHRMILQQMMEQQHQQLQRIALKNPQQYQGMTLQPIKQQHQQQRMTLQTTQQPSHRMTLQQTMEQQQQQQIMMTHQPKLQYQMMTLPLPKYQQQKEEQEEIQEEEEGQLQVNTGVSEPLCTAIPEAANIPLVEKLLSDVTNKPTLTLLDVQFLDNQ